jgi:hypothetical protein
MAGVTLDDFKASLQQEVPPAGLPRTVAALWHDAKGNWEEAHRLAQDVDTRDGAWVHAYLHRKEGDDANADYWYRRADRPHSRSALNEEWQEISAVLLQSI